MARRPTDRPANDRAVEKIFGLLPDLRSAIERLVTVSVTRPSLVAGGGLLLAVLTVTFIFSAFSISTSTDDLLSRNLPWRQGEARFERAFPNHNPDIVAVIDAKTPELAESATAALAERLAKRTDVFSFVHRPDAGAFWRRQGLLYASPAEVDETMLQLVTAQPFLGPLAADPSVRGLMNVLTTAAQGVATGNADIADLERPAASLSQTLEQIEAGKPATLSWQALVSGKTPRPEELRRLILLEPRLDFANLKAGSNATSALRSEAAALKLDEAHGVRLRLTGETPLSDEEFGSLSEHVEVIAALSLLAILIMLWFAVRSLSTMVCILITTFVGLACAAAVGLLLFHKFNVISVAFVPLFVGLGIDFGIQFSVRFRAEQVDSADIKAALIASGRGMGSSLTLAAIAIAVGFFAFGPTQYAGVSQLGIIAGVGMLIALLLNLSLLPALLRLVQPKRPPPLRNDPRLDRIDAFVMRRRREIVGVSALAALVSAALLPLLHFDFNPNHLRDPKAESVSTLRDLTRDPERTFNTLEVLAPSMDDVDAIATKLMRLPEVSSVRSLKSFVPEDQDLKLASIADTALLLDITLNPARVRRPPTDQQTKTSLAGAAAALHAVAGDASGGGSAELTRLASLLERAAAADPATRARIEAALVPGLHQLLNQVRDTLRPKPVTIESLPKELVSDWIAEDGRARMSVFPKGDPENNAIIEKFTEAVLKVAPDAVGAPVSIQAGGKTVVGAFVLAGVLSFVAITGLLFIALRQPRDVAITMAPIVLTGLLTLASCVVLNLPLNFANIIALPLLFGIGVAFHIYFVLAWRGGGEHLLQSSLSRAIFFSALTTATGFGSLWASAHPGTSSMGKLLMISLIWTLVSALLFQPALMGPPRAEKNAAHD